MATYTVDIASDVVDGNYSAGHLSLREAINEANAAAGADTINFDASLAGQTITLTGGELALTNDVTINGDVNGDNKADITLFGHADRIFHITGSGTDVQLDSLTLTHGFSFDYGGAILTGSGTTLTIADTTIWDNYSQEKGGGIYSKGTLTVTGSTISGNSTRYFGGGVYLSDNQSASFTNTTIDGNYTSNHFALEFDAGGGIQAGSGATLTILNSTITNNAATFGGGVDLFSGATATVTNSVIAENTVRAYSPASTDISGTLVASHSFFGTTVTIDTDNGGNINNGGNPLLAALADNGGPVETRNILPGSALINAGDDAAAASLTSDANGNARIFGAHVDIGATELQQLVVTTASDVVADDGFLSLREAVVLANADPDLTTIAFDPSLAGQTITLGSELALTNDVTIDGDVNGDDKADITISGNNASQIFVVTGTGTDVHLDSLTLTNGYTGANGGAIFTDPGTTLAIADSTIRDNAADGAGGGIDSLGTLTVTGSTISANAGGIRRRRLRLHW